VDRSALPTHAADAHRERNLVVLRDAAVAGRLTLDEFAERVERAELALPAGTLLVRVAEPAT
jgi:hypothetical protein